MGCPATVAVQPVAWDDRAAWDLHTLAQDAPGGIAALAREVQEARATAWGIYEAGERVGTMVTRLDTMADGSRDFVITHAQARASVDLTRRVLPVIEVVAWALECARVRIHTERRGLSAKLEQQGYSIPEMVLVKGRPDGL
ncbi:MAG: hypothetical protein ACFCUQ_10095 [Kiloniellales bacterium]